EALLGGDQLLALTREALLRRREQLVHVRAALVLGDLPGAPRFDLLEPAIHLGVRQRRRLELLGEAFRTLGGAASLRERASIRALERFAFGPLFREGGLCLLQGDT